MNNSIIPPFLREFSWQIILLLCFIATFGIVVLYSAAAGDFSVWALNHSIRFLVFLIMALVISRIDEAFIRKMIYPGYIAIVVMLIGVEILGHVGGGSQRWLDLGFIRIQPSELMKPAIVLTVAHFYANLPSATIRTGTAIWPAAMLMAIPSALVLLQPDLGTTLAIIAGGVAVMFVAGLPMRLFVSGVVAAIIAIPMAFFFALKEYQQKRVLTFLNPENDPLGTGYHITQSKIAIGSGGLTGKGFLNGTQSHLAYLPEHHTDFVFATMAEEWGLIGGVIVLGTFALLLNWGQGVAQKSKTRFGQLAATGLNMTIFFYAAINMMMVMGLALWSAFPCPF